MHVTFFFFFFTNPIYLFLEEKTSNYCNLIVYFYKIDIRIIQEEIKLSEIYSEDIKDNFIYTSKKKKLLVKFN